MKKFKTLAEAISTNENEKCNEINSDGNREIIARFNKVKNEYGEFVIKFYENGVRNKEADYYTDDWQDALDTAKSIAQQYDGRIIQKAYASYFIIKENINEEMQEDVEEKQPKSMNFNGKILKFSAIEDCDFCGRKKWVGITQFGSTHYNRLICKDCAEEAIDYYKKAFNSDLTKLKEELEDETKDTQLLNEPLTTEEDEVIKLNSEPNSEAGENTEEIMDDKVKENTFSDLVTGIKNSVWDVISALNGLIVNTEVEDCPNKEEVNELLNQITDDETIVIGMLEKVSELMNLERTELIQQGKDKAEKLLNKDN